MRERPDAEGRCGLDEIEGASADVIHRTRSGGPDRLGVYVHPTMVTPRLDG